MTTYLEMWNMWEEALAECKREERPWCNFRWALTGSGDLRAIRLVA